MEDKYLFIVRDCDDRILDVIEKEPHCVSLGDMARCLIETTLGAEFCEVWHRKRHDSYRLLVTCL